MNRHTQSLILMLACLGCGRAAMGQAALVALPAPVLPPIDPQVVKDQDEMSWDDYRPIPGGVNWADPSHTPGRTIRVAVIAADFDDQPFVITLPKGSDLFGNPQMDPIKREEVSKFYAIFWNGRSPVHHGHTVNEYWMEQSHGKIGVTLEPFGPFHMSKKSFQYGLSGFGQNNSAPTGFPVDGNMQGELDAMWRGEPGADATARNLASRGGKFDLILRIYAGYDETCVWQEFGEMKFQTREDIPPEWGNPDPTMPRWTPTRYVDWTTWKAAQWLWSNSSIIQGECSGSIIHEISHAAFRIGDNNNNPYVTPYRRVGSGPWDIMDRGSFNGPGGPHDRWQIPDIKGGAMPAGLMLRQKINFSFLVPENVVQLSREGLAKSGLAVVTVMARSAEPGAQGIAGVTVRLDGPEVAIPPAALAGGRGGRGRGPVPVAPGETAGQQPATAQNGGAAATEGATTADAGGRAGRGRAAGGRGANPTTTQDRTPWEDPATHPLSEGVPDFNFYSLEVIQRVGFDSFCPDSGVLIAKNKDNASTNGGPNSYAVFNWVIDAHPGDMNKVDFKRPKTGEPVMRTIADYRQLNDALFHAGSGGGAVNEWEDTANRLHFYVIDRKVEDKGILSYTLGIRSLDGNGPQKHDVALTAPPEAVARQANTRCEFTLQNTGAPATVNAAWHELQKNLEPYLASDIYRLSVSVDGAGWTAQLQNALAAVKFGEAQNVPVFVIAGRNASRTAMVTLRATSESDPSKSASATVRVSAP